MPPARVWFNKHLSSTWLTLRWLRRVRRPGEFELLATHPWPRCREARCCDQFATEPRGLGKDDYVRFCLDFAAKHAVTLFVPGRKLIPVVAARERFVALGTRVLAPADAATLTRLDSKAWQYAHAGAGVPLPDYRVVRQAADLDGAYEALRASHDVLCYKPTVSIFGFGFGIVADDPRHPALRHVGPEFVLPWAEARRRLAAQSPFPELMLMQYLEGPERSIDCLADNGRLLRCVIRRKDPVNGHRQVVERNEVAEEVAARLTARLGLDGLFNVQLRDHGGVSYLLEVNPRMSGGLPAAHRCGLVLPYWAVRLALGTAAPDEVPQPRPGLRVNTYNLPGRSL